MKYRPKGLKYTIHKINPTWIKKFQRLSPKTEFKKGQLPWNTGLIGYNSGEQHYNWKGGRHKCLDCG